MSAILPNPLAYAFEDAVEQAAQSWLIANGLKNVDRQRGNDSLPTPRVECHALFGGFQQNEHYYISPAAWAANVAAGLDMSKPSNQPRWLDIGVGQLILKVVTRRDDKDMTHPMLRGTCRFLMQNADAISNKMTLHAVEKIIESTSTATYEDDKTHDVSALSFAVWLRILPAAFPP